MKKVLFWLILIVILAFIGYRGYKAYQKTQIKEVFVEDLTKPVEIQEITTSDFTKFLTFTGDIKGIEEIDVFPKVSGKLVEIKVTEGDRIENGQVLALIDRDITGVKFELAEVTSPVDGIVGKVYLDKGAGVSPPSPSPQMGTSIFRIVNMDKVKVVINVIEKELPKIKVNQSAEIKVEAYPDKIFWGKVNLVSPTVDPQTRTAQAEITLSNPQHLLKPGMFAQVKIIEKKKIKAILVPSYVILDKGDKSIVFVIEKGKAFSKSVKIGDFGSDLIEITDGLAPGETLVVSGQHKLTQGDSIRIVGGIK